MVCMADTDIVKEMCRTRLQLEEIGCNVMLVPYTMFLFCLIDQRDIDTFPIQG